MARPKNSNNKSTGESKPVLNTVNIWFPCDTYYEGLPPFSPGEHEISLETFELIKGKGTYKVIE